MGTESSRMPDGIVVGFCYESGTSMNCKDLQYLRTEHRRKTPQRKNQGQTEHR